MGSCIGTWNELLKKNTKVELAAQRSAPIQPQGFGSMPHCWPRPILHPSHHLVIYPPHQWFDPLGSKPHCWALPSAIGFYPPGSIFIVGVSGLPPLGSTFCHWVSPLVIGCCLPSLGSTPHCWALPSVVGFYPSSSGAAFRHWVIPLISELCPLLLGCTLSRWALLLWHLLCQHGGSSSSIPLLSNPPRGVVDRRYVSSMGTSLLGGGWSISDMHGR